MYNGTKIIYLFQNRSCSDPLRILISTEISKDHSSSSEAETLTPSYCNRKLTQFLPLSSADIFRGALIYYS